MEINDIRERVKAFNSQYKELEIQQEANIRNKQTLEYKIANLEEVLDKNSKDYEICKGAIEVLRQVSDQSVADSYEFISKQVNAALARIFPQQRKIVLEEYTRGNYPQLEIKLIVEGGKERSLKLNTGRGLTQIVSLLSILSLIVITKSRRILVMDEILSGLSALSREIVAEIMWTFTTIGFQFLVNEHGFIPKGAKVYHLVNRYGVSNVEEDYIEQNGVYLVPYKNMRNSRQIIDAVEDEEPYEI